MAINLLHKYNEGGPFDKAIYTSPYFDDLLLEKLSTKVSIHSTSITRSIITLLMQKESKQSKNAG